MVEHRLIHEAYLIGLPITICVLAVLAYGLRIISRIVIKEGVWWDDMFPLPSLVLLSVMCYFTYTSFRDHYEGCYSLDSRQGPFNSLVTQSLWITAQGVLDASIVMIFWRLLEHRKEKKIGFGALLVGLSSWVLASILLIFLLPVRFFDDGNDDYYYYYYCYDEWHGFFLKEKILSGAISMSHLLIETGLICMSRNLVKNDLEIVSERKTRLLRFIYISGVIMIIPILQLVFIFLYFADAVALLSNLEIGIVNIWISSPFVLPIFLRLGRWIKSVTWKGGQAAAKLVDGGQTNGAQSTSEQLSAGRRTLRPPSRVMLPYEVEATQLPIPELATYVDRRVYINGEAVIRQQERFELEA